MPGTALGLKEGTQSTKAIFSVLQDPHNCKNETNTQAPKFKHKMF